MAKFDKDLHQKEMAVRFCLVNNMIPFLEVNVQNYRELSDISTVITDVDALGVTIGSSGKPRKVIFDCKTLNKTSPINRAFWASGLMRFSGCDEAFIVLKKSASEAHRLSAKQIGVHLFDEKQFRNYGESCSLEFSRDYAYSTSIESWVKLECCCKGNLALEQYMSFLLNDLPLEQDCVKGFRKLLAALKKVRGEFDPEKDKHQAIYFFTLSMLGYLMSQIIFDLRNIVDFDATEKVFERALKYYIWSGKDSYELRNKLQAFSSGIESSESDKELKLNNWNGFIELSRSLMDSPANISAVVNPLRELAFRRLVDIKSEKDSYSKELISKNNRIRQFSMFLSRYLAPATGLPEDFNEKLKLVFEEILD
ncbi:hypothetical protein K6U55_08500 [Vibrio diabolicus]|uniref:hypothetical protein n=2 Tax=Vibrio diabolicus TaxID=50719 RepID=UPI00211B03AF|nr:hypothetical protein [Vibrio diabolicus]MCG6242074.1 hypothetical protein [Vibrio diabolicus]